MLLKRVHYSLVALGDALILSIYNLCFHIWIQYVIARTILDEIICSPFLGAFLRIHHEIYPIALGLQRILSYRLINWGDIFRLCGIVLPIIFLCLLFLRLAIGATSGDNWRLGRWRLAIVVWVGHHRIVGWIQHGLREAALPLQVLNQFLLLSLNIAALGRALQENLD